HRHMAGDGSSVPVPVLAGHLTIGDDLDAKDTPPVGLLVEDGGDGGETTVVLDVATGEVVSIDGEVGDGGGMR
ncbi:MAG: hypothetical protein AAFY88_11905, partial [Acidobacteriota bacterium]